MIIISKTSFVLFCSKEMAHWLRALTAFAEDWGLVPSIYPQSSSQLSETLVSGDLTPPQASVCTWLHKHVGTLITQIHK